MALRKASKKAVEYEGQMRDVEVCLSGLSKNFSPNVSKATLSHHLAEFRTFDSDVQQTMHTLRVSHHLTSGLQWETHSDNSSIRTE